ncbi:OLC1v1013108C1 [Oldenlandia corymbosa var. corymbosa]|uniref:OLC1v1013108C1 n=1 Tax=Oldenlandia corymbosa var. corymbosa TaxID=529605 RepID=A0AAV1DZG7_OLDCO|nr:OLC1v1013108C1 [Oldenlandia corymbosa var. corymbosa]
MEPVGVVSMKGQLQELFAQLRSLRKFLELQPEKFVEEDIIAVVCDAGVLIFSSWYPEHVVVDLGLQNLFPTIKFILAKSGEEDQKNLKFNFQMTNHLGFVDFVLRKISELTNYKVGQTAKSHLLSIKEELAYLRSFMGETVELRSTHQGLQALWDRILEVAYNVEDIFDNLAIGDLSDSASTSSFDFIGTDIENIKTDVLKAYHIEVGREMEGKEETGTCYQVSSEITPSTTHKIVGFTCEACSIMNRFKRGSKKLQIIHIMAGVLANMETKGWKKILNALNSGIVSREEDRWNTLELSYRFLPDNLKPCLRYFGICQEDQVVSARRLFCLWIAEGLVRKEEMKRVSDIAEEHLNYLISRSLIMVSKQRWGGGVKACRMHDLLYDFCLQKAKDEQFLHVINGHGELLAFNEPRNLRRICIFSEGKHLKEACLLCPLARSVLFNNNGGISYQQWLDISSVTHSFKLLRVLDLEQISAGTQFPSEIVLLVHLDFLALPPFMTLIPPSIDKLFNLEDFIVSSMKGVPFPSSLWSLQKLKYLKVRRYGFHLALENLDSSSVLYDLDRFSGAIIPVEANLERLMRKFPNIRKFKYRLLQDENKLCGIDKIVFPDFLSQLHAFLSTLHSIT